MKIFLLLIFATTIFSCSKTVLNPVDSLNDCILTNTEVYTPWPIPPLLDTFVPPAQLAITTAIFVYPHQNVGRIVFNPNNENEIAFKRTFRKKQDPNNLKKELCIYNFCTEELRVVTDQIFYDLDWSVTDWLIFVGRDRHVWKIKSNGDSLTQVSFNGGYASAPYWSSDGTKIIFGGESTGVVIADSDGHILETLHGGYLTGDDPFFLGLRYDWVGDSIYIHSSANTNYTSIYDVNTKELTKLKVVPSPWGCGGWKVYDKVSNSVVWQGGVARQGKQMIFSTNLETFETKILIDKRGFGELPTALDVSPNGKHIVFANMISLEAVNYFTTICDEVFHIMDMDGKNEKKLLITH